MAHGEARLRVLRCQRPPRVQQGLMDAPLIAPRGRRLPDTQRGEAADFQIRRIGIHVDDAGLHAHGRRLLAPGQHNGGPHGRGTGEDLIIVGKDHPAAVRDLRQRRIARRREVVTPGKGHDTQGGRVCPRRLRGPLDTALRRARIHDDDLVRIDGRTAQPVRELRAAARDEAGGHG